LPFEVTTHDRDGFTSENVSDTRPPTCSSCHWVKNSAGTAILGTYEPGS
jgi:hypothetical protein